MRQLINPFWWCNLTLGFIHPLLSAADLAPPSTTPAPLPRVLILGDSISIGYTPIVQELLRGQAIVRRPVTSADKPENCEGTTKGVKAVDRWLAMDGGSWDVIHFNFGLHDLKRVDPATGAGSNDPHAPRQADLESYRRQLTEIVTKLKASGARLIFATTTPVPPGGVKPHREVEDPVQYNEVARQIMAAHQVAVNDLYAEVLPQLAKVQQPVNVHFTKAGSRLLAEAVVRHIQQALARPRP